MRTPAPAARRPSPLHRREKSPAKPDGESAFPYEYPASRARPSGESAFPYEFPASRARPSWRTEPEEDDGFEDDDDLYGLEPSYTERSSRQAPVERLSVEPEGLEADDGLDDVNDVDLDTFSAFAYAMTRRSGTPRDASIPLFRDVGAAGRNACSRLAESKGKGKYEGMAPLASIPESMAMAASLSRSIPRSRAAAFGHRPDRGGSPPPPMPAPMNEIIEADNPWSDTYEAFYLTPLPPLTTTTYSPSDLPAPKRRTNHYITRPTIIPPHTVAILIAESANTSPTTGTGTGTTTNTAAASTNPGTTSTSTSTSTTTAAQTQPQTPPALTPDPLTTTPPPDDEGFSEPTALETTELLEREALACIARGCGRAAWRRARGGVGDAGDVMAGAEGGGGGGGVGGGGVVRPRVRKRISRRKGGGRRDG